jgi:hypothetical protein
MDGSGPRFLISAATFNDHQRLGYHLIRCNDQQMRCNLRSMALHGCALVVDYRIGINGSIPYSLRGGG